MARILVTGGLGFIGHNCVRKLQQQNNEVIVIDNYTNYNSIAQREIQYLISERKKRIDRSTKIYPVDIIDAAKIDMIFNTHKPDIVLHLASFPRQKVVNTNPALGSRTMSEGLLNLLEASTNHYVTKFVYVSSSMVYGDFVDDVKENATCDPKGQYGIMKLAGEWLTKDYSNRVGFEYAIIRPSAVYGPYDVTDRVISKFFAAVRANNPIVVRGKDELLDFTYVDDTADGIVTATFKAHNATYNITRGKSVSLHKAANMVTEIAGKGEIQLMQKDESFPSRGSLNIDAAKKDLGYDPKIDIEEGFKLYYDWLRDNEWS